MRRFWLLLHRWLALTFAVPLIIVALLGSMLVVLKPLDRFVNRPLFSVPAGPAAPDLLERSRQHLQAEFGSGASFVLRPPRADRESLRVTVKSAAWNGFIYIDPRDGRELGRRGEREGPFNFVFELHSSLLLRETGKPVLAVLAAGYGILLIGGYALWWPRVWRRPFTLAWNRGLLRALFDVHRTGGAVIGLMIAVLVATGAYMAWKPLSQFISAVAGHAPVEPPKLDSSQQMLPLAPLDTLVADARARFNGAPVGYIALPAGATKPIRVRLMLADDPHPNGLTSVWMHPQVGAILRADRWNELDVGVRANSVIYPLHTGELGGPVTQSINALLGLGMVSLGVTGLWLWWLRRR